MKKVNGTVHALQLELFQIEIALSEFEAKRKEVRARLNQLGAGKKTCTKCNEEMDIEQFYKDKQKFDKRSSWCCECIRQARNERYYSQDRKPNVISRGAVA